MGERTVPDTGESRPVIVRWGGSAWRRVPFPAAIGGLGHVVAAAGSVWVAGWARVDGSEHAVVYRYANGRWTRLDKGLETSINANCLQVFVDGTAWAGLNPGMAHFDGASWTLSPQWPTDGSMISHFDGATWSRQGSPQVQGQLYDLAFRNDQVVAVGERFDDAGSVTQLVLSIRGSTCVPSR